MDEQLGLASMLNNRLLHDWLVWLILVGDQSSAEKYNENFLRAYTLTSPSDLALLWKGGQLSSLDQFLLQSNGKHFTYNIVGKQRRINSVEYFKKGIEPKWEDPKNTNGGRFVFTVGKHQQNKEQIYCDLVFFLLGQSFDHNDRINGFRFISPKSAQTHYRVEIWVDFNDQNMDLLKHFQQLLTNLFNSLNYNYQQERVRFLNNAQPLPKEKEGKESKEAKQIKETK